MRRSLNLFCTIALLLFSSISFAGEAAITTVKAEASPYWWTLLVIPGFVILWIARKRTK